MEQVTVVSSQVDDRDAPLLDFTTQIVNVQWNSPTYVLLLMQAELNSDNNPTVGVKVDLGRYAQLISINSVVHVPAQITDWYVWVKTQNAIIKYDSVTGAPTYGIIGYDTLGAALQAGRYAQFLTEAEADAYAADQNHFFLAGFTEGNSQEIIIEENSYAIPTVTSVAPDGIDDTYTVAVIVKLTDVTSSPQPAFSIDLAGNNWTPYMFIYTPPPLQKGGPLERVDTSPVDGTVTVRTTQVPEPGPIGPFFTGANPISPSPDNDWVWQSTFADFSTPQGLLNAGRYNIFVQKLPYLKHPNVPANKPKPTTMEAWLTPFSSSSNPVVNILVGWRTTYGGPKQDIPDEWAEFVGRPVLI